MPQLELSDPEIKAAYTRIVTNATNQDYVLFGYKSGSNTALHVVAQGSGGLDELEEEFNSGHMQYAFARVKDPKSGLDKFIQINWVGEGVPTSRSGSCSTHASDLSRMLLQGVHLTISARSDDDITKDNIMKKLSQSGGSDYGAGGANQGQNHRIAPNSGSSYKPIGRPVIERGSQREEAPAPVGTNYVPVRQELANLKPSRDYEAPAPVGTNYVPVRNELANIRPSANQGPAAPVGTNYVPVRNELSSIRPSKYDEPAAPVGTNYVPVRTELANLKVSGSSEPIAPVGTNYIPARQELSNIRAPQQTRVPDIQRSDAYVPPAAKRAIPDFSYDSPAPTAAPSKSASDEPAGPVGTAYTPVNLTPGKLNSTWGSQSKEETQYSSPPVKSSGGPSWSEKQAELKRQQGNSAPSSSGLFSAKNAINSAVHGDDAEQENTSDKQSAPEPVVDLLEDDRAQEALISKNMSQLHADAEEVDNNTLTAIALYDYEAGDDGEIGFADGEIITHVVKSDEDWYTGMNRAGKVGLFPATYVELQKSSSAPINHAHSTAAVGHAGATAASTLTVVALYDHEAAEGNEIDFKEGELITHVTKDTEEWWSGTSASGQTGLFPANYVEER